MSNFADGDLVSSLDKLTAEIKKLTTSHGELRQEVHETHKDTREALRKCEGLESNLKSLVNVFYIKENKRK